MSLNNQVKDIKIKVSDLERVRKHLENMELKDLLEQVTQAINESEDGETCYIDMFLDVEISAIQLIPGR